MIDKISKKVILVTGASSGIGKASADMLVKKGNIVFGTSRKADKDIKIINPGIVNMVFLDLQQEDSISEVFIQIEKKMQKIDVIVNNAGFGIAGLVENTPYKKVIEEMEINFFGPVLITQKAIKLFRKQSFGTLINVSSLAGRFAIPYQGYYSASKFAMEAMTESLYIETGYNKTNIKIAIVEPSDISTGFTDKRCVYSEAGHIENKNLEKAIEIIQKDENNGSSPLHVAKVISRIIQSQGKVALRYTAGKGALIIDMLHNLLPEKIFLKLIGNHYGLK